MTAYQLAVKNERKYSATLLRFAADMCELPNDDEKSEDVWLINVWYIYLFLISY